MVALFDFFMAFFLFVPLLIFYDLDLSWNVLWCWPSAVMICLIATLGPGCLLAALNVKYRDFRYVIPFMVQVLFFLTPIIYPISLLQYPILQYILIMSPMYAAVELFRYPLIAGELNLVFIGISVSAGIILLAVGLAYFKRTEDYFADFA